VTSNGQWAESSQEAPIFEGKQAKREDDQEYGLLVNVPSEKE